MSEAGLQRDLSEEEALDLCEAVLAFAVHDLEVSIYSTRDPAVQKELARDVFSAIVFFCHVDRRQLSAEPLYCWSTFRWICARMGVPHRAVLRKAAPKIASARYRLRRWCEDTGTPLSEIAVSFWLTKERAPASSGPRRKHRRRPPRGERNPTHPKALALGAERFRVFV